MSTDTNSSPIKHVKFLCSHGGKILPRPADGHLKYVGGETRIISVPRDIPFQELMKKLTYLIEEEMILKYQVVSEDLDALVSVKSDEDLRHMFDEISNCETLQNPRLRAFLFPVDPLVMENQQVDPQALEQRYIDAINGIIRSPSFFMKQHGGSLDPSTCSSPDSFSNNIDQAMNYSMLSSMHKVQSSPSICGYTPQVSSPHSYYHSYRQAGGQQSPSKTVMGHPHYKPERLVFVRPVGRNEGVRYQADPSVPQSYNFYGSSRQNGAGNANVHYDHEFSHNCSDRRMNNLSVSPFPLSPRNGQGGMMRRFDSSSDGDI